ncbi:unnamed protein product, partial [Discosporangium mesarthrocarpum]
TPQDFWTTRCTNCPAALDSLDELAALCPSASFVAVNIDGTDAAAATLVLESASEGRWTRLKKVHLAEEDKERAKALLGMRVVPFYVIVNQGGAIVRSGTWKAVALTTPQDLENALAVTPAG